MTPNCKRDAVSRHYCICFIFEMCLRDKHDIPIRLELSIHWCARARSTHRVFWCCQHLALSSVRHEKKLDRTRAMLSPWPVEKRDFPFGKRVRKRSAIKFILICIRKILIAAWKCNSIPINWWNMFCASIWHIQIRIFMFSFFSVFGKHFTSHLWIFIQNDAHI